MNNDQSFMFDPARLTQARDAVGMTKKNLAEKVSLSPSAITQFESGIIAPTGDNILNISHALGVQRDYFYLGRPVFRSSENGVHFRSLRSTSVRDRKKAQSYIEWLRELINFFESEIDFPILNVPRFPVEGSSPEESARKLRDFWGVKPGPVKNLINLFETNGGFVSILEIPEADKIGAFSVWLGGKPIISINKGRTDNVYVQRFTTAHEIGHLVMHGEVIPGDRIQENEADRFAAEFLMPKSHVIHELPSRISMKKVLQLSQRWGVSAEAILYRSKELGVSSEQSTRRGFMSVNTMKKDGMISYPPSSLFQGERPRSLKKAFSILEDEYSISDIADVLQLKTRVIRNILGIEESRPHLSVVN